MVRKWKQATMGGGGDYHLQPRHCVALSLFILVSATLAFLAYVGFFFQAPLGGGAAAGGLYQWWRWQQGSASTSGGELRTDVDGASSGVAAARATPTSLSHIVFGIGGAARTWGRRRGYVELWWRPGQTCGHVWLDEEPSPSSPWPAATSPPYRVSPDASRFGRRAAASRMARIVADSFAAVAGAGDGGEVRWFVMGDDDTVFFPDNLVTVLRKYDHEEMYYVGAPSESVAQNAAHSYGMAFGGGGFALSYPAAAALARAFAADDGGGCLDRYRDMFGSDERVHACLAELGVPLTREPGFHQLDFRGDASGFLAAHPVAPLVSLHHLDLIRPISPLNGPTTSSLDAVRSLVDASRHDPARTLQQAICYHRDDGPSGGGGGGGHKWTVSVSWGYAAQVYPWAVPAHELEAPLQTFEPLRKTTPDGLSFVFNTRPWRPDRACARPMTFFLSSVRNATAAAAATVTEYMRHVVGKPPEKECDMPGFRSAAAVWTVRVMAPKMDPSDWHRAPRRHCCETERDGSGTVLEVRIRRCAAGRGELAVATP